MYRSDNCTSKACKEWIPFPVPFYIEGVGLWYVEDDGMEAAAYFGDEHDQLLYFCNPQHLTQTESVRI